MLTLEDEVKSKRLSANLVGLPVSMAVSRLLEGVGVNYIVMMDPSDWGRVDKIFVGAGGGGPARAAGPVQARTPMVPEEQPVDEAFEEVPPEDFEEGADGMDPGGMGDAIGSRARRGAGGNALPDEFGGRKDPSELKRLRGARRCRSSFLPRSQFPRSSFTPGFPGETSAARAAKHSTAAAPGAGSHESPQATMPFTDPFGRPIPVPPGMNQQQQQPQQRQQQQQQQQQR